MMRFLIAIIVIVAAVIFAGCVEEKISVFTPSPTETPLPETTPTPKTSIATPTEESATPPTKTIGISTSRLSSTRLDIVITYIPPGMTIASADVSVDGGAVIPWSGSKTVGGIHIATASIGQQVVVNITLNDGTEIIATISDRGIVMTTDSGEIITTESITQPTKTIAISTSRIDENRIDIVIMSPVINSDAVIDSMEVSVDGIITQWTSPKTVGSVQTVNAKRGQHVIVAATFNDGTEQVILDTIV